MKFLRFEIEILNNPVRSYFPGQVIQGALHVTPGQSQKLEGIQIQINGEAQVRWEDTVSVEKNGKQEREDVVFQAKEKYFEYKFYVFGTGNSVQTLPATPHHFPFEFSLPNVLPSSFMGKFGSVTYEIKAVLKRTKKEDYKVVVPITVNGILDLNSEPGASDPVEQRKYKSLCCLWCQSGPIGFVLKIPRRGFVPGEYLQFTAELSNQSNKEVRSCTVELFQVATYHVEGKTNMESKRVTSAVGPAVSRGETEIWQGNILRIPPVPPTRLANCSLIDVQYMLKIEMDISGFSINLRAEIPIIIGTIPFRNAYEEIMRLTSSSNPEVLPSAPPEDAVLWAPTAFLRDTYPDLPPPTYEETILQDYEGQMGDIQKGQNPFYDNNAAGGNGSAGPSAPPLPHKSYLPKYVTYGWQAHH